MGRRSARIVALTTAVATAVGVCSAMIAPLEAGASPDGGDLVGLRTVDSAIYGTYSTYGAGGWQFTTTDGVHCRIMTITRWQSPPAADCWGPLPGVNGGTNYAFAKGPWFGPQDYPRSGLDTRNLDDLETYRSYEHRSGPDVDKVDPASYRLLPTGSKLVVPDNDSSVNCGVPSDHNVVCTVVGSSENGPWQYGFTLSPQGSHAF
jgi:hypothetical protein